MGGGGAGVTATTSSIGAGTTTTATSSTATGSVTSGGGSLLGPEYCPADGPAVGVNPGDKLPSLEVRDCDGNVFSLDDVCGAEGLWIFAAHGWCPLCQNVSGKQEAIVADYEAQGLVALNIVVETGASEASTDSYCALWRDTHMHDKVYTLHDPTGEILQLWPGAPTSLSMFVDKDRVISSKLEYSSNETAIRAEIDKLFVP